MACGDTRLYLDTMLWNALYDVRADPTFLLSELGKRGLQLVIGTHLVYELAKIFQSKKPGSQERGKALFKYLGHLTTNRVPCLRQNADLLRQEAKAAAGEGMGLDLFYGQQEYYQLSGEVDKLSRGVFDDRADSFISRKKTQVREIRQRTAAQRQADATTRDKWANLSFQQFLGKGETKWARDILKTELRRQFPNNQERHLTWVAKRLLASPRYRLSHALVRAHLYQNWRSWQGGALPRDILDDCLHVVNASYCDIYATKESGQEKYAPEVLTNTTVAVWTGSTPLADWLCSLNTA